MADKQSKSGSGLDSRDPVREAAVDSIKNKVDAAAGGTVPDVVTAPPPAQQFWWGRWSSFIQPGQESSSFVSALAPGRELAVGNEVFGIVREAGTIVVPNSGVAKFQLGDAEAYMMEGRNLIAAQVSSPSLTIDFGARRFDTSLTVTGNGHTPVGVQASGQVTWQGELRADANAAGTKLQGVLSNDASQAAYVFQRDVTNGLSVVGATRWYR